MSDVLVSDLLVSDILVSDLLDNAHFLFRRHQFVNHTEATCLWCKACYPCTEIVAWIDGGTTPLCPRCEIDFVIPGRLSAEELAVSRARLFKDCEGMTPMTREDWDRFFSGPVSPDEEDVA